MSHFLQIYNLQWKAGSDDRSIFSILGPVGFASLVLLTLSLLSQSAPREDPKVSTHIQERGMLCGGGELLPELQSGCGPVDAGIADSAPCDYDRTCF